MWFQHQDLKLYPDEENLKKAKNYVFDHELPWLTYDVQRNHEQNRSIVWKNLIYTKVGFNFVDVKCGLKLLELVRCTPIHSVLQTAFSLTCIDQMYSVLYRYVYQQFSSLTNYF